MNETFVAGSVPGTSVITSVVRLYPSDSVILLLLGIGELEIIGVLRPQVRVSFLVSIRVEVKYKGIQVIILWPVDSTTVREIDLVLIVNCMIDKYTWKQIEVVPRYI